MASLKGKLAAFASLYAISVCGGCAMVVGSVGEALVRTVAEGVAIELAVGAACEAKKSQGQLGQAACGTSGASAPTAPAAPPAETTPVDTTAAQPAASDPPAPPKQ